MNLDFVKNVSHLVVVGANTAELLKPALLIKPGKVTVFSADDSQVKQLQQQYSDINNLTIKQAVVATASQSAELYQYNLSQFNALAPATDLLKELFPGLKLQQKTEIETVDIADELKSLGLTSAKNMLMLSAPEQNLNLLQHLANTKQLNLFSTLVIQHSAEPYYKNAAPLSELSEFLIAQNFELVQTNSVDPDFPVLQFYRDSKAIALKDAERKITELSEQLVAVQQQLVKEKQHSEKLEQTNQQAKQQATELTKQLDQAKQQAAQQATELTKQLDQAKQQAAQQATELTKQLDQAKQQAEQKATELTRQLDQAKQQTDQQKTELTKQLDTAKTQQEKLQKDLEQFQKHAAQRLEKIADLEKAKRLLEQNNSELSKRQQALEREMLKAEAQIDIIKELMFKPE